MSDEIFEIKLSIDRETNSFRVTYEDKQLDFSDHIDFVYTQKELFNSDVMDGYARFLVTEAIENLIQFKQAYRIGKEGVGVE